MAATTVDTLLVRIEADMSQLRRQLSNTQRITATSGARMRQSMDIASRGVSNLTSAFFNLGSVIATLGISALGFQVVRASAEMEDLRASLNSVFQSAEGGEAAFDFINQFAQRTPFDIQTLSRAFIQLGGAGIAPTEKLLTTFGDAASVTTDKVRTFEALIKVFQRSVGGGLGLEELNIINEAGIPVLKILQDELNLARQDIAEFGQSAEGAAIIMETLNKGLDARFAGAMATASQNLSVRLSNLGIAANNTLLEIGEGGLNDAIKLTTDNLTSALTETNNFARILGSALGRALIFVNKHFDKLVKLTVGFGGFVLGRSALAASVGVFQLAKAFVMAARAGLLASISIIASRKGILGLVAATTAIVAFRNEIVKTFEDIKNTLDKAGLGDFVDDFKKIFVGEDSVVGQGAKTIDELEASIINALSDKNVDTEGDFTVLKQQAEALANPLKEDTELLKRFQLALEDDAIKNSAEDTATFTQAIDVLKEKINGVPPMVEATQRAITDFSDGVSGAFADMVMNLEFNMQSLNDIFKSIQRQLLKAAIQFSVINPLINRMMNPSAPMAVATEGTLGGIASFFGGTGKASGGSISRPTMVGERGPELFIPHSAGVIKNAHDTRGMMGGSPIIVNQNLNIETGVAQTVRAEILTMMPMIQNSTVSAVQNARQRGGSFAASFGG
tara:strand:+ start:1604 stop:3634 length:2031 start_codon:yes stop_codon:yes gene_type:complete